MMKELIKLAESKGFESYFMIAISFIHCSEHVITDPEFINHLWLCELQKWLREKHKLEVLVVPIVIGVYSFKIYDISDSVIMVLQLHPSKHRSKTYEEALEKGLFEALKLIKI